MILVVFNDLISFRLVSYALIHDRYNFNGRDGNWVRHDILITSKLLIPLNDKHIVQDVVEGRGMI